MQGSSKGLPFSAIGLSLLPCSGARAFLHTAISQLLACKASGREAGFLLLNPTLPWGWQADSGNTQQHRCSGGFLAGLLTGAPLPLLWGLTDTPTSHTPHLVENEGVVQEPALACGLRLSIGKTELARCFPAPQCSSAHWFLLPFPLSHALLFSYLNLFFPYTGRTRNPRSQGTDPEGMFWVAWSIRFPGEVRGAAAVSCSWSPEAGLGLGT